MSIAARGAQFCRQREAMDGVRVLLEVGQRKVRINHRLLCRRLVVVGHC